jgi:hypothetical protein
MRRPQGEGVVDLKIKAPGQGSAGQAQENSAGRIRVVTITVHPGATGGKQHSSHGARPMTPAEIAEVVHDYNKHARYYNAKRWTRTAPGMSIGYRKLAISGAPASPFLR